MHMTVNGWIFIVLFSLIIMGVTIVIAATQNKTWKSVIAVVIGLLLTISLIIFTFWYINGTAAGQRSYVDQKSNFQNGLERTVTVYTANGDVIAQYKGKIDIKGNNGGYVLFDFEGKRYMYYNCFVEAIADIN